MMDWTDRHCRVLHRTLTRRTRLYTEMVTAQAVLHGDRPRLLGFSEVEHPLALQLGGSEPWALAEAARVGEDFGYDEINLNVGCPSDRVQSGRFGACLMREPELVAECMAAMIAAVRLPVTLKCRIGVDEQDPEESLFDLADACAAVGVRHVAVHARKAWLKGLSPKENRDVPPLDYALVYRLKAERPALEVVLNGGVPDLDAATGHLAHVDGVMLGRAAYHDPGTARPSRPAGVRGGGRRHPAPGGGGLPPLHGRTAGVRDAAERHDPPHARPVRRPAGRAHLAPCADDRLCAPRRA